ncbi:ABC transporter G family member 23-like isoform X2 [Daktulosphaira vitifoliae]|nr:ABC transporter G family member 23-like isoform X2 [Daktulosphaira vitifoliae]
MSKNDTSKKIAELYDILRLPNKNSYIKNMSGGQNRRLSIAISILHDPKLIILDEPTVGIDPLLRYEIWCHFETMVREQDKTIIITTHYIEEAYQANRVGLMRNGILIEEASPREIITKYNADSLEAAFLNLCCNQDAKKENNQIVSYKPTKQQNKKKNLTKSENIPSLTRIRALLTKNSRVCLRDYMLLFNLLIMPMFQTLNLCFCIGMDFKNMPVAYKNDEATLADCKNLNCILNETSNEMLSCNVLNYLSSLDYDLIEVDSIKSGELSLNKPTYMAFIHFPNNYTETMRTFINDKKNYDLESMISVQITSENILYRNQFTRDILFGINNIMQNIVSYCSYNVKLGRIPVDIKVMFGQDVKYLIHSLVAIIVAMGAYHFPCNFSLSFILTSKIDGTINRSMFAGVTPLELLLSLFLMNTVYVIAQLMITIPIIYLGFSNPIQITSGIYVYIIVAMLLGCIGFFFGLVTAGISTNNISATYLVIGCSFSQFLLAGALWPIEGQPTYVRPITELLPLYIAGKTMNNITLKGWTIHHPEVFSGTMIILSYTIILLLIVVVLGRVKKDMWGVTK